MRRKLLRVCCANPCARTLHRAFNCNTLLNVYLVVSIGNTTMRLQTRALLLLVLATFATAAQKQCALQPGGKPQLYRYEIVGEFVKDPTAFTQGAQSERRWGLQQQQQHRAAAEPWTADCCCGAAAASLMLRSSRADARVQRYYSAQPSSQPASLRLGVLLTHPPICPPFKTTTKTRPVV